MVGERPIKETKQKRRWCFLCNGLEKLQLVFIKYESTVATTKATPYWVKVGWKYGASMCKSTPSIVFTVSRFVAKRCQTFPQAHSHPAVNMCVLHIIIIEEIIWMITTWSQAFFSRAAFYWLHEVLIAHPLTIPLFPKCHPFSVPSI